MSILLLASGLLIVTLPGALAPVGARLAPSEWCRAVAGCLRVGWFAIHAALALMVLPVVFQAAGAHEIAHACHRSLMGGLPVPPAAGWAAAGALVASMTRSVVSRRRDAGVLRRLRAEPWLGDHRLDGDIDVVMLPCADRVAYAVPGRPAQVVVSEGLREALDEDELRGVLHHERAHIRHGHHRVLSRARDVEVVMGWFSPARASVSVLRLAVERWADEDAGQDSPTARPAIRRALLKTVGVPAAPVPAFTDAETVVARVRALAATPPAPSVPVRLAATGPLLGMSLLVTTLAACSLVLHHGAHALLITCPF